MPTHPQLATTVQVLPDEIDFRVIIIISGLGGVIGMAIAHALGKKRSDWWELGSIIGAVLGTIWFVALLLR